jgi:hypothetical protein
MKKETTSTLKAFGIELVTYSVLVIGYFLFVLHLLGHWLLPLYQHHRLFYSALAIVLILGQAVLLEFVTTLLLRLIHGRTE